MPILNIQTTQSGLAGVLPAIAYIATSDTEAQVLVTGYLNNTVQSGLAAFSLPCIACVSTIASAGAAPVVGWYNVAYVPQSGVPHQGNWSLTTTVAPGNVVLPTIANHLATYTDVNGTLSEDPATAISGGNLQAGLSGTAGYLASFPGTASKGSFHITAVANTGDTITTLSNVAMGQASVVSIPDPANAVGRILVGASSTPFVSGNFPVASGTGGLMVDSGKSAATLPTFTSPTIANHIAVFTNTAGNLGEDVSTAINAGNIQAGLSGTAGTHISFPATAANGSLILAAVNAGGAFNTTISNGTMAQSCVYTIPDVTAVTGQFLVKTAALVNGNLVQASGTAGVTVDSGIATANVQLKTQVKAATTANIGGAGAGPITVSVTGLTSSSVVVATIASSSNTAAVAKAVAGTNSFNVTFTADPGATCTLNYVAYIAAQ